MISGIFFLGTSSRQKAQGLPRRVSFPRLTRSQKQHRSCQAQDLCTTPAHHLTQALTTNNETKRAEQKALKATAK